MLGYFYMHSGKKLLFMGGEFGQYSEWRHDSSLDWHLLQFAPHQGVFQWVKDLNRYYRSQPALHEQDFSWQGFDWIDCHDWEQSVLAFLRWGKTQGSCVVVVCNFTPVPRYNYRIGVPFGGVWREVLNSDGREYWGSGMGNMGQVTAGAEGSHGRPCSLNLTLPPLSVVAFEPVR